MLHSDASQQVNIIKSFVGLMIYLFRLFVEQQSYRTNNFQTCREDSPVIAQFCGDSPDMIGRAAEMIGTDVNAVDINFGCPQVSKSFRFLHSMFYVQGIAKRGHYGSFLLQEPDLVEYVNKLLYKFI